VRHDFFTEIQLDEIPSDIRDYLIDKKMRSAHSVWVIRLVRL